MLIGRGFAGFLTCLISCNNSRGRFPLRQLDAFDLEGPRYTTTWKQAGAQVFLSGPVFPASRRGVGLVTTLHGAHHHVSRYHPNPCSSAKARKVRKPNLKRLGCLETWCRPNRKCHGFDAVELSFIFKETRTVLGSEYVQS